MSVIEKIGIDDSRIFLEESKREYLHRTYERGIRKGNNIHYEVYENATILPIKKKYQNGRYGGEVGVIDCEGNYVANSRIDDICHYGGYQSDSIGIYDKTVVYCGTDFSHWGHFLVNTVPRLWIALRQYEFIDEYVIVRDLNSDKLSFMENQIEFLQLLGIFDKVRIIDQPTKYTKVIVPETSYWPQKVICGQINRGIYYNEFLDTYNCVINKALEEAEQLPEHRNWASIKKVFLSRSGLNQYHLYDIGIEVIDSFFRNNGYELICSEKISLIEMVYYLHHCESIAYMSGTLQHNMLFAPQGCDVIALERRLFLTKHQTDIDIIKKISATYISGQYSLILEKLSASAVYAYTRYMKEYAKQKQLMPPDNKYLNSQFLEGTIKKFLKGFIWDDRWVERMSLPHISFCLGALLENSEEIAECLSKDKLDEPLNSLDPEYWKHRLFCLLIQYNVPYWRWDEKNQRTLIKTFSSIIERNINLGKRDFLIFPFGTNGMLFEQVLRQRYGIIPRAVFDNHLAKYNPNIKELKEIDKCVTDDSCIVLTTLIPECREELEKYCDLYLIESPFSIW